MRFLLSCATLLCVVQGLPASSSQVNQAVLATFDDLTTLPGVAQLTPVGTYKGLDYNSLDVLQAGVLGLATGVEPQSGDQTAVNNVVNDLTSGAISLTAATVGSFDLKSLYFGCVATTVETVASVPIECTVAFTAFKKGSSTPAATVNQQFNPANALVSQMSMADFGGQWLSDFSGLDRVDVAVVQSAVTSTLSALLIDSVSYETHTN